MKFKNMKLLLATSILTGALVGCQNQDEPKNDKEVKIESNLKQKVNNSTTSILGISYKNFDEVKDMLSKNKGVQGDNVIEKLIYSGIFAEYQNNVDKQELNSLLVKNKVEIEANGGKYTPEIKNEITNKYIIKKGTSSILEDIFPIDTETLSELNFKTSGVQFISKSLETKKVKDIGKISNKMEKDLKNIKDFNPDMDLPVGYSLKNYSEANPFLDSKDWVSVKEISDNKEKGVQSYVNGDTITFVKVVGNNNISSPERMSLGSMYGFNQYTNENKPKDFPIDLIRTLDSFTNDFNISKEDYKHIEKEIDNLSEDELQKITSIFVSVYLDNWVNIK